ncbi:hypothetical protein Sjap_017841 [Stephania japonica]|uniref:Uncharacterized protein n=1 Tax=Stephania japonica TaxID=461633 RepID=A0AAP0NMH3_9MAGN
MLGGLCPSDAALVLRHCPKRASVLFSNAIVLPLATSFISQSAIRAMSLYLVIFSEDLSEYATSGLVQIHSPAMGRLQSLEICFEDPRARLPTWLTIVMPCALVEKAAFGLLKICQRLLPYKENLADDLLRSLQLVLKLDARVVDAYSRHPEASEAGFEALTFIMADGAHLSPVNYVLCVDSSRQFAVSAKDAGGEEAVTKVSQDIGEMWLRLFQGLRKVCLDQREDVRNHALSSLQRCLMGVDAVRLPQSLWSQCIDMVIFTMLVDLIEIAQGHSPKDYRNMEAKVRGKRSNKLQELVPELLKNTLLVMKTKGVLVQRSVLGGDSLWELTWLHVNNIALSLQSEVFPDQDSEQVQQQHSEPIRSLQSSETLSAAEGYQFSPLCFWFYVLCSGSLQVL